MRYSVDTSIFIHAWNKAYPYERFPSLWREMGVLIDKGILIAADEVKGELEVQKDELYKWVQQRSHIYIQSTAIIQQEVTNILKQFRGLANENSLIPVADPFVIALAKVKDCTVITQEKGGSIKNPNIPIVCKYYKIRCIDLFEFVNEQNWSF